MQQHRRHIRAIVARCVLADRHRVAIKDNVRKLAKTKKRSFRLIC